MTRQLSFAALMLLSVLSGPAPQARAEIVHSIGGVVEYRSGPIGLDGFEGATFNLELKFPDSAARVGVGTTSGLGYSYTEAVYAPTSAKLTITNTVGHLHDGIYDLGSEPDVPAAQLYVRRFINNANVFSDTLSYVADLSSQGTTLANSWSFNFGASFGLGGLSSTDLFLYQTINTVSVSGGVGIPGTLTDYIMDHGSASAVPEPMTNLFLASVLIPLLRRQRCNRRDARCGPSFIS